MGKFFAELKRRNVFRVAIAYLVTAWLLIEISSTLEETLLLPDWADTLLAYLLILGFPVVLFFSWAFEITPEGLKREKDLDRELPSRAIAARRLNIITIVILVLAVGLFAFDRFAGPGPASPVAQGTAAPDLSIAVLPFVNMSSDPEQEFFSDGLTEELLNLLAGIKELKVAARTSSFFYKNKLDTIPLLEIAGQLSVAHVLEGSVRRSGDRVRITAQLIDTETGFHLWSDTWDRDFDDIFEIQDEIAAAVAEELRITLLGEAGHSKVIDTESYELAMQGRFFYNRRDEGDTDLAFERFRRAVEIDPDNATAWIGLVPLYLFFRGEPDLDKALQAVENALQLEPENPEAVIRHAGVLHWLGRIDESDAEWARALEIGQDNALVMSIVAGSFCGRGDFETCIAYQERAVSLDPLHPVNLGNLSSYYIWAGDFDGAERWAHRLLEIKPGDASGLTNLAEIQLARGAPEAADSLVARIRLVDPNRGQDAAKTAQLEAAIAFSLGNEQAASEALQRFVDTFGAEHPVRLAALYAWRGETDKASAVLDEIADSGSEVDQYKLASPLFASMRDDPSIQRLRR